ncbi:MAG: phytoene desaturase family protein [Pseudomonadota bacterium]
MSSGTVAVIGAGMGGLSAAIDARSRGLAVTLFERAPEVGGKLRAFRIGDHAIDSGPTVFTMRWIFDDLFAAADAALEDYVPIVPADTLARHYWDDGSCLDLHADLDASCAAVEAFASARDADAYRRFTEDSGRIFDTLDSSFMRAPRPGPLKLTRNVGFSHIGDLLATRPFVSLWRDLTQRFQDPRLAQLFGRYATYCGSNPFLAPATLMLIAEAERRGVWYVTGGMLQLAVGLEKLLRQLGGTVRTACPIRLIDPDTAGGYRIETEQGHSEHFDAVIFNGDSEALAAGLLGPAVATATPPRSEDGFSLSAVTWSLAGSTSGIELSHHTVLFSDDYRLEFEALWKERELPPYPTLYLCAPQAAAAGADRQPLFLLANAPSRTLSAAELDTYEAWINAALARHGLTLDYRTEDRIVTTPNSFAERFPGSRGALYGRPTHGFAGSFRRPGARTRLPGLFLAGGSVHPGAGIPMATQSGRLAAADTFAYLSRR